MRQRLLITVAVAAVSCVLVAPAQATFKGSNGRVAYDVHSKGIADSGAPESYRALSTVQPDGRADRFLRECQLSGGMAVDGDCAIDYLSPSWSPDATRLVFDTGTRLALIGATGTGYAQLPAVTADDSQPTFAPSGRKIAFAGRSGGRPDLYTLDLGTRKATRIARNAADPDWSSGNRIAFERSGSIYISDGRGKAVRRVARGRDPGWSPSGRTLVYARPGGIYAVAARGGKVRRIVRCSGCSSPVYSPNSKLIAYDGKGPTVARADNGRTVAKLVSDVSRGGESFDASNPTWAAR